MRKLITTISTTALISCTLFAQSQTSNSRELKEKLYTQCKDFLSSQNGQVQIDFTCNCMTSKIFNTYSTQDIDEMVNKGTSKDKQETVTNILDACKKEAIEKSNREEDTEEELWFGF